MTPSPRLTTLLNAFESCRLAAYWDGTYIDAPANTVKRWSVGWGTTRLSNRLVSEGDTCTQQQADAWRDADIAAHATQVNAELAPVIASWNADPHIWQDKFDALVDFAYNAGDGHLKGSTLLKFVLVNAPLSAAEEFTKWTLAGGKRSNGLLRRRLAERALFLSDFRPDGKLKIDKTDFPGTQWYPV